MKTISTLLLLCAMLGAVAQEKTAPTKLFYFQSKDSLYGVKDQKGRIIVKPEFTQVYIHDTKTPIETPFLTLMRMNPNDPPGLSTYMSYFDRQGQFLFHPYWFDNGPDLYNDGLMRFIENNKFGFADIQGKKKIEAKFDYAEAFRYGLSFVCTGCKFTQEGTDDETLQLSEGSWGLINTEGKVIIEPGGLSPDQVNKITDSLISLAGFPEYNAVERSVITKIEAVPGIKKWLVASWQGTNFNKITFLISERPYPGFPYFLVKAYGHDNSDVTELESFLASKDGKVLYSTVYDMNGKPSPIATWIEEQKQYEREARRKK
jgi:hypothetical protein